MRGETRKTHFSRRFQHEEESAGTAMSTNMKMGVAMMMMMMMRMNMGRSTGRRRRMMQEWGKRMVKMIYIGEW